jgi:PAS domain S-box-containing protein
MSSKRTAGSVQTGIDAAARLAAIVDSSFDAIVSKDLNGIITSWNGAAERLFGYTAEEAIGKSILILIPEKHQDEEAEIIAKIRRGERVESFETARRRKDGSLVSVSLTISPIVNQNGVIVGASKIARDITATKESERRIRLLLREVNHRVKNQYAVILSMIRETSKYSGDKQDFINRVRERIMALSTSHDLLVTAEWKGASLFELIQEQLAPFDHGSRITLSGSLVTLQAEAVQALGMAFHELGTNSSKYGALSRPGGHVEVRWSLAEPESVKDEFQLTWEERWDAPPAESEKEAPRFGFGTVVLKRVAPVALGGVAKFERSPGRVRWQITCRAGSVAVMDAEADIPCLLPVTPSKSVSGEIAGSNPATATNVCRS